MKLISFLNASPATRAVAAELFPMLGLSLSPDAPTVLEVKKGSAPSLSGDRAHPVITYSRPVELSRMFSFLPRFLEDGKAVFEKPLTEMLSLMSDNSRNAVLNMKTAKEHIRYLALMGFDSLMLYTEDTYEIPSRPYFGYMRGRFSEAELKELDAYGALFGVELIPCIQTLAHLSTALRLPGFEGYTDTSDILLVGDERTYRFVADALDTCRRCFHSRRINIGMDEAHMLGRGEYLDRNGYRPSADIFLEHLSRVTEMCHARDFRPMIWSDMFFRMAFHGAYYIDEGVLPQEVVDQIPEGIDLVYWDYYSTDSKRVAHMLQCHKQCKGPTIFAGGAWKWYDFSAYNAFSIRVTKAQLDECFKAGVRQIIMTSWGDDGAASSQYASFATLLYTAERAYGHKATEAELEERAKACFGTSFHTMMAFDLPDALPELPAETLAYPKNPSMYLFYNDPLERLFDRHLLPNTAESFRKNAELLEEAAKDAVFGYALETLLHLLRTVSLKCDLGVRLEKAYQAGDKAQISAIAETEFPAILSEMQAFLSCLRRQWNRENKPFGFMEQEIRVGGLISRMGAVKERLLQYVSGEVESIPELEEKVLPVKPREDGMYIRKCGWGNMVTTGHR